MLDYGRKLDIEELEKARVSAKSRVEREMYELLLHRIKTQNEQISALRQKMILALRANDKVTVKRCQDLIQMIRLNSTYGKSWGNQRGERQLNNA